MTVKLRKGVAPSNKKGVSLGEAWVRETGEKRKVQHLTEKTKKKRRERSAKCEAGAPRNASAISKWGEKEEKNLRSTRTQRRGFPRKSSAAAARLRRKRRTGVSNAREALRGRGRNMIRARQAQRGGWKEI